MASLAMLFRFHLVSFLRDRRGRLALEPQHWSANGVGRWSSKVLAVWLCSWKCFVPFAFPGWICLAAQVVQAPTPGLKQVSALLYLCIQFFLCWISHLGMFWLDFHVGDTCISILRSNFLWIPAGILIYLYKTKKKKNSFQCLQYLAAIDRLKWNTREIDRSMGWIYSLFINIFI